MGAFDPDILNAATVNIFIHDLCFVLDSYLEVDFLTQMETVFKFMRNSYTVAEKLRARAAPPKNQDLIPNTQC